MKGSKFNVENIWCRHYLLLNEIYIVPMFEWDSIKGFPRLQIPCLEIPNLTDTKKTPIYVYIDWFYCRHLIPFHSIGQRPQCIFKKRKENTWDRASVVNYKGTVLDTKISYKNNFINWLDFIGSGRYNFLIKQLYNLKCIKLLQFINLLLCKSIS